MTVSSPDAPILVVGAGIAGLTAAAELARAGERCILVERDAEVGGLCRTYELDGIRFDLGPHLFFHNPDAPGERRLFDLLRGESVVIKGLSYAIRSAGRYWPQPLRPWFPLTLPCAHRKELVAMLLARGRNIQAPRESLHHSLASKTGPRYYEDVYEPLLVKKAGRQGRTLHADWLKRIVGRSIDHRRDEPRDIPLWKVALHILKYVVYPHYCYPRDGFGLFARNLWREYADTGCETCLNCVPKALGFDGDRVVSATFAERTTRVSSVIWTGSVNDLNPLLGADSPKADFMDIGIVLLSFRRRPHKPHRWIYTYHTEPDVFFARLYYPDVLYGEAGGTEREGVCAELTLTPEMAALSEQQWIDRTCADLERLGLFQRSDLVSTRVLRLKDCMPIYDLDYEDRLTRLFSASSRYRNLYAIGRRGGFYFCQAPAAVHQGLKVAQALLANRT